MVFKYLLLIAILRLLLATRRPVLYAFLFVARAMGLVGGIVLGVV